MESHHWITTGREVELSAADLFYCNGGSCADGWHFVPALEAARQAGVGLGRDLPYVPFGECRRIPAHLRVSSWAMAHTPTNRKRSLLTAPMIGGMAVFTDLLAYRSGIYRHVAGSFEGNHAVCVVGYDDPSQCWIVKNSWSDRFGEGGFFRIQYGQCEIDLNPFFSVDCVLAAPKTG